MKINATEQTSTFPIPLNKLKGRLMDELGRQWDTLHGKFEVNKDTVDWIVKMLRHLCMMQIDLTYIIKLISMSS